MKRVSYRTMLLVPLAWGVGASVQAQETTMSSERNSQEVIATGSVRSTLSVDTLSAQGAAASLGGAEVRTRLGNLTWEQRDPLFADLDIRLQASSSAIAQLRPAGEVSAELQRGIEAANADLQAKERRLKASLAAARKANAQGWVAARRQLAADWAEYATTVDRYQVMIDTKKVELPAPPPFNQFVTNTENATIISNPGGPDAYEIARQNEEAARANVPPAEKPAP